MIERDCLIQCITKDTINILVKNSFKFKLYLANNKENLFEIISSIRNIRSEKNVGMSKKINISLEVSNDSLKDYLLNHQNYLMRFTNYENLIVDTTVDKTDAVVTVLEDVNIAIPLKELINIEEEIVKLNAKKTKLEAEVARSNGMLNNPNFVSKAPKEKIENEKAKLASYLEQLKEVEDLIKSFQK